MKGIDLTNKCGSCGHFQPVDGTAMGECLLRPYGEDVVHDPHHPYQMVPRSKVKCTWYNKKPMTNGDRIRAMSDEELAKWTVCPYDTCGKMPPYDGANCAACVLEWLKQPAEVENAGQA